MGNCKKQKLENCTLHGNTACEQRQSNKGGERETRNAAMWRAPGIQKKKSHVVRISIGHAHSHMDVLKYAMRVSITHAHSHILS